MAAFRKITESGCVCQGRSECPEADRKLGTFSSERPRKNDLSNFLWHPSTSCSLCASDKRTGLKKNDCLQVLNASNRLETDFNPSQCAIVCWANRMELSGNWYGEVQLRVDHKDEINSVIGSPHTLRSAQQYGGHTVYQFQAKTYIMSNKCHMMWTEKLGIAYNLDNTINQLSQPRKFSVPADSSVLTYTAQIYSSVLLQQIS